MTRKVVGIGSVDAHGFLYRAGPLRLTIFPYKVQFKTLRTHLILDEPLSRELPLARQQVYSALRDCRAFISNFRWGEARDFKFEIRSGNEIAICGGSISLSNDTTVCVQIPRKATIRLIADGKLLAQKYADRFEYQLSSPGIYRVEVYRGRKGWIFSNHIRVISPKGI